MPSKIIKDVKIWTINDFPIHVEYNDSEIIISDEEGNTIKVSKKDKISIILDLIGSFKTD